MASRLQRALARALAAPEAPRAGGHVVVAISGGPDSTALLAGLVACGGLRLTAVHVEHALRGPESAGDREAAEALARRCGVPFRAVAAPIAPGSGVEERARRARHRALRRIAAEVGASRIALAHTRDDQVETVLLRLLRGAGRGGLAGMRPARGMVWRPLLESTRDDVHRHLAQAGLPARLDRSNADLVHARNRVRRLVVPLLEREFNPRLGAVVAALARRLRDEDDYLAALADARLPRHRREEALAVEVAGEPAALGRRMVRRWLDSAATRAADAATVERVLALAAGRRRGAVAVAGPARIVREGEILVRRPGRAADAVPFRQELRPGDRMEGPGGAWRLAVGEIRARDGGELRGLSASRARFDADAIVWPLIVRSRMPGDRLAIAGVGTRKLQDVLVDARVPRERRATVPVVTDAAGNLLWVAGVARAATAMIGPSCRRVVDATLD